MPEPSPANVVNVNNTGPSSTRPWKSCIGWEPHGLLADGA